MTPRQLLGDTAGALGDGPGGSSFSEVLAAAVKEGERQHRPSLYRLRTTEAPAVRVEVTGAECVTLTASGLVIRDLRRVH